MSETEASPRPGSGVELSRRMDRMEQNHEALAKEVASLTGTVARVEQNQTHQAELNRLRFDALDSGLNSLRGELRDFIKRIEGLLNGEVETIQTRQGRELVEDYQSWRRTIDLQLAGIFRRLNYLFGGLALTAFVLGLVVPTILGWFKP